MRRGAGGGRAPTIEPWALFALAAWLAITVAWWALALWPMPQEAPAWLARARSVCFNTSETGLPDASGWLLLIGQPSGMLGVLLIGWWRPMSGTLAALGRGRSGRLVLASGGLVLVGGIAAAGVRVAEAGSLADVEIRPDGEHPPGELAVRGTAGPLDLLDQRGERVTRERLRGRWVMLTFAFGHCETVCPVVVRNALAARRAVPEAVRPVLLVVTLDPWRDTSSRLAWLARRWGLDEDAYVLGGAVDEVNRVLDGWAVPRGRDPRTGDIVHTSLVYLLDGEGRVVGASNGSIVSLEALSASLISAGLSPDVGGEP